LSDDLEPLSTDPKRKHPVPTPETLRALLRYDPETGKLFWRPRGVEWFAPSKRRTAEHKMNNWNSKCASKEAFTTTDRLGYRQGRIFDRGYLAHRVIWAMVTGSWPEEDIDHEDRNPGNNRWDNLRAVPHAVNMRNLPPRANNTSGVCGVSWSRRSRKWYAQIRTNGKPRSLGLFDSFDDAVAARKAAEAAHGYHKNHGKPLHG
jgi:hypothetical protein